MLNVLLSCWNKLHELVLCVVKFDCDLHVGTAVFLSGDEGHQSTDCPISRLSCGEIAL